MTEIMELAEKDFKIAILNILQGYKICEMKYHCALISTLYIVNEKMSEF